MLPVGIKTRKRDGCLLFKINQHQSHLQKAMAVYPIVMDASKEFGLLERKNYMEKTYKLKKTSVCYTTFHSN